MKTLTMLMMATLTILSIPVFAQDTTKTNSETQKNNYNNRSKKEQMKMEVMKIDPMPVSTNITTAGAAYNTSKKEQMKMEVMGISNSTVQTKVKTGKAATCSDCVKYNNRSKKEQMKMEVMKIPKCTVH